MTSFWVISGVFIVTALLFVIPTLLRNRESERDGLDNDALNVSVYREHLTELEQDLQNDILTKEQYEVSKQEMQQRMLQDISEDTGVAGKKTSKIQNIAVSTLIALALPVAAVSLYLLLGDTRGLLPQAQLASVTQQGGSGPMQGGGQMPPTGHDEFSSVLDNLIARLKDDPSDIEGWVMLGRTYAIMGRYDEASETYTKLVNLVPDNPQLLSDYADVLAMKNQGSLVGRPAELIAQALKIDPEYPKALALAGTVEYEQKNYAKAAAHWEKLLSVIPADSQLAKSVSDSIADAKSLMAGGKGRIASVAQQQPQAARGAQASNQQKAGGVSISGRVTLNKSLASKVSSNDTLFIYAKAKTGPKMPLAILRLKASDLPATFELTDEMAMMPAMKISSFPEVIVEARLTKTGQAFTTSGDLQGFSQPVKLGDSNISVEINRQVP